MRIGVIGAGSWGTALADVVAVNGHTVTLWAYEADLAERMQQTRHNDVYLPNIKIQDNLVITHDLHEAVRDAEMLVLVAPTQATRTVLAQVSSEIGSSCLLVSASKGIELDSLCTVSQVCQSLLGGDVMERFVALSGPTFAREVALRHPSLIVAGSRNLQAARTVQEIFSNQVFRVYTSPDAIGVEIGGAVKNVIAIAAGIADGLGFGHNTRVALVTRGLAEIRRLGKALGALDETFSGLAGMGDLVLTCTGDLSRNRTVGVQLGKGKSLETILGEMRMVAEGVKSAQSVYALSCKLGVEMPITEKVYDILYGDKPARQAVVELMTRALKPE